MDRVNRIATFVVTLVLAVILQVVLVVVDGKSTPVKTAIAFSKAYYKLDPCMAQWLCKEDLTTDDGDAVDHTVLLPQQVGDHEHQAEGLDGLLHHGSHQDGPQEALVAQLVDGPDVLQVAEDEDL